MLHHHTDRIWRRLPQTTNGRIHHCGVSIPATLIPAFCISLTAFAANTTRCALPQSSKNRNILSAAPRALSDTTTAADPMKSPKAATCQKSRERHGSTRAAVPMMAPWKIGLKDMAIRHAPQASRCS
jgi:hypothetical protein